MRKARVAVLVLAVAAAGGAYYLSQNLKPQKIVELVTLPAAAPAVTTDDVLIAAHDLPLGKMVMQGDLSWQPWPKDSVLPGMIRKSRQRKGDDGHERGDRPLQPAGRRADPAGAPGQGSQRRLPVRRAAERQARGRDQHRLAGRDIGGRLHSPERPRRCHPNREAGGQRRRRYLDATRCCATSRFWRSARTSRKRTASRSWWARMPPSNSIRRRPRPSSWRSARANCRSCCAACSTRPPIAPLPKSPATEPPPSSATASPAKARRADGPDFPIKAIKRLPPRRGANEGPTHAAHQDKDFLRSAGHDGVLGAARRHGSRPAGHPTARRYRLRSGTAVRPDRSVASGAPPDARGRQILDHRPSVRRVRGLHRQSAGRQCRRALGAQDVRHGRRQRADHHLRARQERPADRDARTDHRTRHERTRRHPVNRPAQQRHPRPDRRRHGHPDRRGPVRDRRAEGLRHRPGVRELHGGGRRQRQRRQRHRQQHLVRHHPGGLGQADQRDDDPGA